MSGNDTSRLDEDEIRDSFEKAEPPPGTIAWAQMIVNRYESQISGSSGDITRVYEALYVTAAAIFSIEDGGYYARLRQKLRGRGVRIGDWERRVREAERRLKSERESEEKARHNKAAAGGSKPATDTVPAWPELTTKSQQSIDGNNLLSDVRNAIQKFVYLKDDQALIVALWVLFTWTFDKVAETNPYLRVLSPVSNCGKSTLLKLLRYLTRAGWLVASSTKSSFVRKAQNGRFTFLLDEGDAFLQENEEMRNVLDAASDPDTANVSLSIKLGNNWVPADINVFIPIAIASIKELRRMATVENRSIQIWLKRATRQERAVLTKARRRAIKTTLEPIADRCARWAQDNARRLAGMRPALDFEDGRNEDKWEPLIGIADYLDVQLGKQAREIAAAMIGRSADDQPLSGRLLADIKSLFDLKRAERLPDSDKYASQALCDALAAMPERPWQALPGGKGKEARPITQNRLARMLRDFQIEPRKIRVRASTPNGYERKDFEDAWQRYAANDASEEAEKPDNDPSENPESANCGDPEWNTRTTQRGVSENAIFQGGTEKECSTSENGPKPLAEKGRATVPLQNCKSSENESCAWSPLLNAIAHPPTDGEQADAMDPEGLRGKAEGALEQQRFQHVVTLAPGITQEPPRSKGRGRIW
jgi:putative DNA primase/helicase